MTTRRLDCGGLSEKGSGPDADSPERFLIGHLGKSMLVPASNTGLGCNARLLGGSQGHLLMVADGVGSTPETSSVAAEVALDVMAREFVDAVPSFFGLDVDHERELRSELEAAVASCRRALVAAGARHGDPVMGSSLTAAYVLWSRMYVVHLGDSRCYLVRDGEVHRLTTDHVRRVRAGTETRDETIGVLTNALGAGIPHASVDFAKVELDDEDAVILCTASLAEALDDERRLAEAVGEAPAGHAAEALIESTRPARGTQDATVVVARFTTAADPQPRVPEGVVP